MPIELLIVAAAIAVSVLIFTWVFKVIKTTLGTAFKIALIALGLQVFLGVGPQTLWQHIVQFWQQVVR